jgi:hypothetical protein
VWGERRVALLLTGARGICDQRQRAEYINVSLEFGNEDGREVTGIGLKANGHYYERD